MEFNYTKIDIIAVETALEQWKTAISNFDNNELEIKTEAFFQALKDANLDGGFIESYYNNNETLKTGLTESSTAILSTLKNMEELDQSVRNDIAEMLNEKPTTRDPAGGGSGGGGGGGGDTTTPPTTTELIDNSAEQLEQYANMSMSDLYNVAAELSKIADDNNTTLEQILSGEDYTLKIHSALLASPNITEEFKQLIELGDTSISQKILANIFQGNNPEIMGLNDNIKNVIKVYLGMVAENNNISLQQLLSDANYNTLLKDTLSNFGNLPNYLGTLNDENMGNSLLDVYDGNGIGDMGSGEVSIVRSFIDASAQTNNSDVESMLSNAASIKGEVSNLGKASVFMNTLTKFSGEASNTVLSALMGIN